MGLTKSGPSTAFVSIVEFACIHHVTEVGHCPFPQRLEWWQQRQPEWGEAVFDTYR